MIRDYWLVGVVGMAGLVGLWVLFIGLPEWYPTETSSTPAQSRPPQTTDNAGVISTLFFVSEDGMRLMGVEREIERRAEATAQARLVLEAQLSEPPAPLLSPIPDGTTLRAIYLTERGDAFVDLSEDILINHSGGSLEELFTVYAIVNALTTNIPAISAVQILVNGQEVDTLVGHVDLQRPLASDLRLVGIPEPDPEDGVAELSSWRGEVLPYNPRCTPNWS
ncbi:MAG: GerMN domain-containing protein [Acidobacteriota bacterium]|nr:GerMN domain-containing protein [Acidobacteriota bacterium]